MAKNRKRSFLCVLHNTTNHHCNMLLSMNNMNSPQIANNLHFCIDLISFQFIPWPTVGSKRFITDFRSSFWSLVKHCFCFYRSGSRRTAAEFSDLLAPAAAGSGAGVMIHNNNNDNNLGSEAPARHHNLFIAVARCKATSPHFKNQLEKLEAAKAVWLVCLSLAYWALLGPSGSIFTDLT